MLRVLIVRSNPVDPDSRVEKAAKALASVFTSVTIFAWDRKEDYKEKQTVLLDTAVTIRRTGIKANYGDGKKSAVALLKFQLRLFFFLVKNRKNYDCIHACDFDTGFVSLICSKLFRKKMVYDIFDFYADSHGFHGKAYKLIKKLEFWVISKSDATIICSEKRIEQISGSKPKRLSIIHNTPDIKAIAVNEQKEERTPKHFSLVYVGILGEGRLIKELLEIFSRNQEFDLHIGGFGPLEDLVEHYSERYTNIHYHGRLQYEETLALEKSCDVMTAIYDPEVKNHYYAAPNKFYEALALGKPLIVCKNTSVDDTVSREKLGQVIDFNEESLEAAIYHLFESRHDFAEMSKRMRCLYEKDYSWEKMKERLIQLYEEVVRE